MIKSVLGFLVILPLWASTPMNVYKAPTEVYNKPEKVFETSKKKYGPIAFNRMIHYVKFVNETKKLKLSEAQLLKKVNYFVNGYISKRDDLAWGKKDQWLTREQFLIAGYGDCEEYALTKYFTLLDLGFDQKKIYMGVVDDRLYNQGHMILLYYPTPKTKPIVYDNASFKIEPLARRRDLKLKFVFNHSGTFEVDKNGLPLPPKNKKNITYTKPFYDLLKQQQKNEYFR